MVKKVRTLGFTVAFAIGLGTMIATGIFSLSETAVAAIGSSAVSPFVIAAPVASITAGAYSEFASIYSESGGGYLFTSRTLDNDYVVYAEGVILFLGYWATQRSSSTASSVCSVEGSPRSRPTREQLYVGERAMLRYGSHPTAGP